MTKTILIVDDEPDIRAVVADVLTAVGFETIEARDGLDALELLNGPLPSLLMVGWQMPRMDGVAFARALEQRGLRPKIPLLFMSGYNAARGAEAAHADAWLSKPFDIDELLEKVGSLVKG